MATTTNYNLYIEDGDTARFLDWRKQINGTDDSNMVKIDTALGEKADHSTTITATLTSSGWTGDAAPYTQAITVTGLSATQNGTIALSQSATAAQRETSRKAILSITGHKTNTLTIVADGEKPGADIPVIVTLLN